MSTDYLISKEVIGILAALVFISGWSFLLFPNRLNILTLFLNKRVSLRKLLRPLEIPREADEKIYKIRKVLGAAALACSLALFVAQVKIDRLIYRYIIIWSSVLIFMLGLDFLLFSQSLRKWGSFLDKWFSLRRFLKPLDIMRDVEDKIYKRHRILGIVSLLSSIILAHWYIRL